MYKFRIQRNTYILHDLVIDDSDLLKLFSSQHISGVDYTMITIRDNIIMIPVDKFAELTLTISKIEVDNNSKTITF